MLRDMEDHTTKQRNVRGAVERSPALCVGRSARVFRDDF